MKYEITLETRVTFTLLFYLNLTLFLIKKGKVFIDL